MTLRPRRPGSARSAFTLTEILVVMGIITLLMSLLMAAVSKVRDSGKRTENFSRMAQVSTAVGIAKQKVYLPYVWAGPFNLKKTYTQTDPELDILLQMFPNMDLADNGYVGQPATLDTNQTLVLMLTGGAATNFTGFSNNAKKPFSPPNSATPNEQRKGPFLEPNLAIYSTTPRSPQGVTLTPNGHPWLIDPFGVPYAVFAPGKVKTQPYTQYSNGTLQQPLFGVSPFQNGGKFLNETSFQIVSAGSDRQFGTGVLPATGPGDDDQANFSQATLGGGVK